MSKWDEVLEKLSVLYEVYCKYGPDDETTLRALEDLIVAYDEWLG